MNIIKQIIGTHFTWITACFSSFIALVILNADRFFNHYFNDFYGDAVAMSLGAADKWLAQFDPIHIDDASTFIIWSLVGIVFYVCIWLLSAVVHIYLNDQMRFNNILLPRTASQHAIKKELVLKTSFRSICLLLGLIWLILLFSTVLPSVIDEFYSGWVGFMPISVTILAVLKFAVFIVVGVQIINGILLRRVQ